MTEAKIPNSVEDLRRLLTARLTRNDALDIRTGLYALCTELKSVDTHIDFRDGDKMEIKVTRPKSYTGQATIGSDVKNLLAQLGVASDITKVWKNKYGHPILESAEIVFSPSDFMKAILPVTRARTIEAKKTALQAIWDAKDKGPDAGSKPDYLAELLKQDGSAPKADIPFPR